jgi:hypothetical protein
LDQVIESVSPQGIAYEAFSFYNLFFGQFGLFNEEEGQQNATAGNATEGAMEEGAAAGNATEEVVEPTLVQEEPA